MPKMAFVVAVLTALAGGATPRAHALSVSGAEAAGRASSGLVKVHDNRRHDRRHNYQHHSYHRGHVVDAPFAHVESGGHTVVDAPFVHIYNGRHGQHIVAPFVDHWEPR